MAAGLIYLWFEEIEDVPRRSIRDRSDPLQLPEELFVKSFRINKDLAVNITERLKNKLPHERIPPLITVLTAMRFLSTGSYQNVIATDMCIAVSQKTVSRCIDVVVSALNEILLASVIKFPTINEQQDLKHYFYTSHRLPGLIGAIDCTHVAIIKPSENSVNRRANCYMNRKSFYSINVQLISDNNLRIRAVNARYPGSVHDGGIRNYLENQYAAGNRNSWMLGDSGYPLEPWLLTPYSDPVPGSSQERFNRSHSAARNCIERCNGVLKSRFRCLLKHRVLHYEPTKASFIINACCILHNLCIDYNLPVDDFEPVDEADTFQYRNNDGGNLLLVARRVRDQVAASF